MKKIASILVSGAVIAAFAGFAGSADLPTESEMMKKVDEQQGKVAEKKEKASEAIKKKTDEQHGKVAEKEGKMSKAMKNKDKVIESAKQKKKKAKEIKESKAKPMEKATQAKGEGEKSVQEMKDLKKEMK